MTTVNHEGEEKSFARCHLRGDGWGYACILICAKHVWYQIANRDGKWKTLEAVSEDVVRADW